MSEVITSELTLADRFETERIAELTERYLRTGEDVDLLEMAKDQNKEFVVSYIHAGSEFADVARSVEYTVFADAFKQTLEEVDHDYGKYDAASTFAVVIDVSADRPTPAGVLRIIEPSEIGFKDINDLVVDDHDNPWIDEIKAEYFEEGEEYDPVVAWQRMAERKGVVLDPRESVDIATHASAEAYRGAHGALNGVSMLFYHACLRFAMSKGYQNLLAIFDLKPFENLQQHGAPFDTYEGVTAKPYGGPYDTIPAYCKIDIGAKRILDHDEVSGLVFRDAALINETALLPNDYTPDQYSDSAVDRSMYPVMYSA